MTSLDTVRIDIETMAKNGGQGGWTMDTAQIGEQPAASDSFANRYVRAFKMRGRAFCRRHAWKRTPLIARREERKCLSDGERTGLRGTRFCFRAETRTMRKNIFRNVSRFRILISPSRGEPDSDLGSFLRNASCNFATVHLRLRKHWTTSFFTTRSTMLLETEICLETCTIAFLQFCRTKVHFVVIENDEEENSVASFKGSPC